MSNVEILNALRPNQANDVIDMVEAAGIDTTSWGVRKDGSPSQNMRANPAFVYEWAFGGDAEPILLCIWHRSLKLSEDTIFYYDTIRKLAEELDRIASDPSSKPDEKTRARSQARRAQKFDSLAQQAFRKRKPVRVVLLEGNMRSDEELGLRASEVEYRLLDSENWWVHSYSVETGHIKLVRGVPPPPEETSTLETPATSVLDAVDDLDDRPLGHQAPERVQGSTTGFARDSEVRDFVRNRSRGYCEFCGAPGFALPDGVRYVETHHMIWLCNGGPDTVENVIALCANHHREVHFGGNRVALEQAMWKKLLQSGIIKTLPEGVVLQKNS